MRRKLDQYYTDPVVARALVELLPVAGRTCLEPHVGGGAFARALVDAGASEVTVSDLNAEAFGIKHGGHLVQWAGRNFLGINWGCCDRTWQWVVGNPPYLQAELHVRRALDLAENVAFLLRLGFCESRERIEFWKTAPLRKVWVLAERPSFAGSGTDQYSYGFFHWQRGYEGPAEIVPGWSWKQSADQLSLLGG